MSHILSKYYIKFHIPIDINSFSIFSSEVFPLAIIFVIYFEKFKYIIQLYNIELNHCFTNIKKTSISNITILLVSY